MGRLYDSLSIRRLKRRVAEYFDIAFNHQKTIYPRELLISSEAYNRVIVITPHADDETFGCGGTIRLSTQSKKKVRVICISDNIDSIGNGSYQSSEIRDIRKREFEEAMKILGVTEYDYMDKSKQERQDIGQMAGCLGSILIEYQPDVLYVPSVIDNHVEHRTLHQITYRILNIQKQFRPTIRMYEVWSAIYPNVAVDISPCIEVKIDAMSAYASQQKMIDYPHHILGLNAYRAMSAGAGKKYVEAFAELSTNEYLHYIKKYSAN